MEAKRPADFAHKRSLKVSAIAAVVVLIAASAFALSNLQDLKTTYSVKQFFPEHDPSLKLDQQIRSRFQLKNLPLFAGIISLPRNQVDERGWLTKEKITYLKEFEDRLQKASGVKNMISIASVQAANQSKGEYTIGRLVEVVAPEQWPERVAKDAMITPNLVSQDLRTVMIYVQTGSSDVKAMENFEREFRSLLRLFFPLAKTQVGGIPAVQTDLGVLLNQEVRNLLIYTLLACLLTLMLIFRSASAVAIPLILTLVSNALVFYAMAKFHLEFTVLSATVPILVFITVVSIAIHILLRVEEEKQGGIMRANRAVFLPNLLGAATTALGFLTLLTSDVPMIRQYGITVAMAVGIAWLATSLFILPLLILLPSPQARTWVTRPSKWALLVIQHRRVIVGALLVVSCTAALLGKNLNWKARLFDDLPAGQEARISTELLDRKMGGVVPLDLVIELPARGDWMDPGQLKALWRLEKAMRRNPEIGSIQSLPDFLRAAGQGRTQLPKTRAAIAESVFLYSLSNANPLTHYLSNDGRAVRLEARLHDLPADQSRRLTAQMRIDAIRAFPGARVRLGGMAASIHKINNTISQDLIFGFWQALVVIGLLLALVWRSVRWALIACLPNLVSPIFLIGYLALSHTPIKPGVAIIFSIALGLAFNNTVYALNRLRAESRRAGFWSIRRAFYLESNSCLVSTLVMFMGFSVFLFSLFSLNKTFGVCMLISLLGGLVGDLVLLPSLLYLFPKVLGGLPSRSQEPIPPLVLSAPLEKIPQHAA